MSKYHLKHQGPQINALLDKAGTALQEHQDISHLAKKAEVQFELGKKQNNIEDIDEIRRGAKLGSTSIQDISHLAVKDKVLSWLSEKVDKIPGKQLTTEDFTTLLKQKLESLQNYDDTAIRAAIAKLRSDFDTLVESDTSGAIDKFNEIIAFLDGIEDSQSLDSIIASIERQIAGKQSAITDLDTIRDGAAKGSTSVQTVKVNGEEKKPVDGVIDLGNIDPAVDTYVADFNLHDVLAGRSVTIKEDFVEAIRNNKVIFIPYRTFVVIATAQLQADEDSWIYLSIQARINEQLIEVQFSCDTVPSTVVGRIFTTTLATKDELDKKVENKADKNGKYLELAAGYYVGKNVELSGEVKSGNLNAGGGITNFSSTHLFIDISNVPNDSTIRVSTTSNSEYSTLWALWEVAYDPATVNWKYLLDKGPLCSVAQSADIDLSRYEGRAPRYLYVAVGEAGNSASATVLLQTKNIAQKFDEVEKSISKVGEDIDGRLAKVDKVEDVVLAKTFLTAKYYDYNSFVKELYIYPQFIDADFVVAKCYRGKFYIRPQIENGVAKYTWQAVISLNELSVDNVYDIITTVDGAGDTPIGTKVGYVVFSDIVNLSQINDEGFGDELNISVISSPTYSPIILSSIIYGAQQLVNTDDIADGAITNDKMNYEVYSSLPVPSIVYKGTIEDLWIDAQYLVDANKVNVRCYKGDILIRAYQDEKTLWTFRQNIQSIKNGELCPIVVDEDIIGYIIFKDIDKFRSYSSVDGRELVNLNLVTLPLSSRFHSPINIALSKSNKTENKVEILLPSTINCVVGDELRIYYKSIVKVTNASSYNVKVVSAVGKAYPKYYVLKASTIGTYIATFSITDNNGVDVAVKNTTINVVSAMSAPTTQKNVLVFGASATASGYLAGELKRRLTETSGNGTNQNPKGLGLGNISFVGREQGTSVAVNQEATGGWSWSNYAGEGQAAYRFYVSNVNQLNINDTYTFGSMTFTITEINVTSGSGNIRCTYTGTDSIPANGSLTRASGNGDASIIYTSYTEESFNPFWNNGKLDFVNYANKYCGGSIDVIISHCGMNDMSSYTVNNMANLFTNYIKPFVRAYHSDFPNGKVIISTLPLPSPTGGMGANYGASATWNWQSLSLKLWEFARLCEDMCKEAEFSSYVYVADCIPTFDCETSYPYEEKSVNTRSTVTEHIGSNGVHPTKEGSYQVSDAIYSIFNVINK